MDKALPRDWKIYIQGKGEAVALIRLREGVLEHRANG